MQSAYRTLIIDAVQNVPLISPARRPLKVSNSNRTVKSECLMFAREQQARQSRLNGSLIGKGKFNKGGYLMKTTTKSKCRIPVLLSILCAGLVATFLGGCAESPYVAYNTGYYPTGYYTGYSYDYNAYPYTYYGPAYNNTIVRSGVRYNDAYGPRYYSTRTVYGDW
jgi:hypothetical protein